MEFERALSKSRNTQLFSIKGKCASTLKVLLEFIQAYNQIFDCYSTPLYSTCFDSDDDTQMILKCVWKFRGVYRSRYRGVLYLTSGALQTTHQKALNEAVKLLNNFKENDRKAVIEVAVRNVLAQEQCWIEQVNGIRQQYVVDSMKKDALEEFMLNTQTEFPALFDEDSLEFYDGSRLSERLNEMKTSFMSDFQEHIPFIREEAPVPVTIICKEIAGLLHKKCIEAVIAGNHNREENAQGWMDAILKDSVSKYKEKILEATGATLLFNQDEILKHHATFRYQFVPDFTKFGNTKCRSEYLKRYKVEIYKTLRSILNSQNTEANRRLDETEFHCQVEIQTCFDKISKVFRNSKIGQDKLTDFKKMAKEKFRETIRGMRRSNAVDGGQILRCAKNENYPDDECNTEDIDDISAILISNYVQNLRWLVREETVVIQQFHKDKKQSLCEQLEMQIKEKFGRNQAVSQHLQIFMQRVDKCFEEIAGQEPQN